jgi:excinuclease ABC subunit A
MKAVVMEEIPAADTSGTLEIYGAREHNLKNVRLTLPRNSLIVITGVSGSGKSSLAFDTLYAEGQRRYLETYSAYLRQFVGNFTRPDVDKVEGLSPVIAIDQKTTSRNPRSTVGTVTEIYDFMRLLFARIGQAYSYLSGRRMEKISEDEMLRRIQEEYRGENIVLLAPLVKGRKGHYREELAKIARQGYSKARIDGAIVDLVPKMSLDRYKIHDIEIVIDRLLVNIDSVSRLTKSVQTALREGKGSLLVLNPETNEVNYFCKFLMDPETGLSYEEPAPNSFSFNSPYGACPVCKGLGRITTFNDEELIHDPSKSILKGAFLILQEEVHTEKLITSLKKFCKLNQINLKVPFQDLPEIDRNLIVYGNPEGLRVAKVTQFDGTTGAPFDDDDYFAGGHVFYGLGPWVLNQYLNSNAESIKSWLEPYIVKEICPECKGARLKRESLHFRIDGRNIYELSTISIAQLQLWFETLPQRLNERDRSIAHELIREIDKRLRFMIDVGLEYLALDRSSVTLSGGESQRIRLATQIGTQLIGVLYILDEPSIGLHQRDNHKLIDSLKQLRDLGNTVIVVEHDRDMMAAADFLVDIGPGAGRFGGQITASGTPDEFMKLNTPTAHYLSGRKSIPIPDVRRQINPLRILRIEGANGHNLKSVNVNIPLGIMVCVTGVSGSGKSSLVNHTLYPLLHQHVYRRKKTPLAYSRVTGLEFIDKVIEIDQKPIGRTPRSNPATYTGLFTQIRDLFTSLPESQIRGYKPGRFSFNVKGGRCEECRGAGIQLIEMNFLPDMHVECPVCRGRRYNRETLEIRYKGKSINDVLNMSVSEAARFFEPIHSLYRKIKALEDVGLGYITLGQPATTLSGGEAQRMKIATELSKRDTGNTFYILDEPTTGLHFQDTEQLLSVLQILVDRGNTVLVIEHNLDVIKVADWVIDLGPEGGDGGGQVVAYGTPEDVARCPSSHTGRFLNLELNAHHNQPTLPYRA